MTPRRVLRHVQCRGFELLEHRQPANFRIPSHFHAAATLLLGVRGEVTDRIGGRDRVTGENELFLRPAGAPHTHSYGNSGAHHVSISMDPSWLARISAGRLGQDVVHAGPEVSWRGLLRELAANDAVTPLAVESSVVEVLALLSRTRVAAAGGRARVAPWLLRARDALRDFPTDRITLGDLARAAGVHEGHLTRAFRSHFGSSIGEYARAARIRSAARMLIATNRSLATVALDAGFCDQSHFQRVFRRLVGCTPRRWRAEHRTGNARIVQSSGKAE